MSSVWEEYPRLSGSLNDLLKGVDFLDIELRAMENTPGKPSDWRIFYNLLAYSGELGYRLRKTLEPFGATLPCSSQGLSYEGLCIEIVRNWQKTADSLLVKYGWAVPKEES